jgi:hypothetical protein
MTPEEKLTKEYLDGSGFAGWLYEIRPELEDCATLILGANLLRRLWDAKNKGVLTIDTADRICVKLGLHVDIDIPDHLWIDPPKRRRSGHKPWEKLRTYELAEEGYLPGEIAGLVDVNPRTVRNWLKQAA